MIVVPDPKKVKPPDPEKVPDKVAVPLEGDCMLPPLELTANAWFELFPLTRFKMPPSKTA
jgi:hypothetical protein